MYTYICIHVYVCEYVYIYIYTWIRYTKRRRERETNRKSEEVAVGRGASERERKPRRHSRVHLQKRLRQLGANLDMTQHLHGTLERGSTNNHQRVHDRRQRATRQNGARRIREMEVRVARRVGHRQRDSASLRHSASLRLTASRPRLRGLGKGQGETALKHRMNLQPRLGIRGTQDSVARHMDITLDAH